MKMSLNMSLSMFHIIKIIISRMTTQPSQKLNYFRLNQLTQRNSIYPSQRTINDDKTNANTQRKSISLNQFKQNAYQQYERMSSTPKKGTIFQIQKDRSLKAIYRLRKMIHQCYTSKNDETNRNEIKFQRENTKKLSQGTISDSRKYSIDEKYRKQSNNEQILQYNKINPINAVLIPLKSVDKHFTPRKSKSQIYNLNLSHSQIVPKILNPEQLIKFAKSQVNENNKRILERLQQEKNKDKQKSNDKRIHQKHAKIMMKTEKYQIIEHQIRRDFPIQICTNRIIIPRVNYKQRWMDKLHKLKITDNLRDRTVRKQRVEWKNINQEKHRNQLLIREKDNRIKTDLLEEADPQNIKQFLLKKKYWDKLTEEALKPWGYQ